MYELLCFLPSKEPLELLLGSRHHESLAAGAWSRRGVQAAAGLTRGGKKFWAKEEANEKLGDVGETSQKKVRYEKVRCGTF